MAIGCCSIRIRSSPATLPAAARTKRTENRRGVRVCRAMPTTVFAALASPQRQHPSAQKTRRKSSTGTRRSRSVGATVGTLYLLAFLRAPATLPMQTIDALICPRWTVRVEPQVVAEEGLALAIDAGRIVDVLPVRRSRPALRAARAARSPQPRAAAGSRQRAHARGDDAVPRPRGRPAVRRLVATSGSGPPKRAGSGRSSSRTARGSRSPRC